MQFVVGAGGTVYDGRTVMKKIIGKRIPVTETKAWNPEWRWEVSKRKGTWAAEFHIPMSVLGGPPKPGEMWRMNFTRERRAVSELSVWSPQSGGFGDPKQFGEVRFVK